MKSWTLSPDLLADQVLVDRIEALRTILADEVGSTADLVDAEWSAEGATGERRVVRLRLSDWTWPDGVVAYFVPKDLGSERVMRANFRWLWGDLLQARNHRQIEQLLQTGD